VEALVLLEYFVEAVALHEKGSSPERIDKVIRRFGMPMGPLELLDEIGLDVAAHVQRSLGPVFEGRLAIKPEDFSHFHDDATLGKKTGKGIYVYTGKSKTLNKAWLSKLDADYLKRRSGPFTDEQIRDRLILLMVNEAGMCLAEGIAADAPTIDLAMVFGTGWAPHRGGPLRYADDRGLKEIVRALDELAKSHGLRFEPCAELRRRAESGENFYATLTRRASEGDGQPSLARRADQPDSSSPGTVS
jgi:3-hydroxyacyl-CoA dehydrogenase / enoyl-CoA hydratase / 3-hydroxybutyryl-CoA epimerase